MESNCADALCLIGQWPTCYMATLRPKNYCSQHEIYINIVKAVEDDQ